MIQCPLCTRDVVECVCDPATPGYHHPDLAIDAEIRADRKERDDVDASCGIRPGWHKEQAK